MSVLSGKGAIVASLVGIATALVMSRNKFLMTNAAEVVHRFQNAFTGDRYENIKAIAELEPWFGKGNGVAIVTGSNSGIGFETALGLARTGCRVILAVRSKERGEEAAQRIRQDTKNDKIDVMSLDMNSLASVREFSQEFIARNLPLHILVHNAGAATKEVSINADGFETGMALNYLNVVLLTSLLLPVIKSSGPARVVIVGSSAHFVGVRDVSLCFGDRRSNPVNGWDLYGSSKLNVVAYSNHLARELAASENSNVAICSVDPGFVATAFYQKSVPFPVNIFGKVANIVAKNAETGAHSSLFAALSPTPPTNGAYIADTLETTPSATSTDRAFQAELIDATVKKIKAAAPWWNGVWV